MTVWSLEGGRLFPVEDQLEQKQRTGKGKACFPAPFSPRPPQKRALYFLGEKRGGELHRYTGKGDGGGGETNAFWHWGEESAQGPSAPLGQLHSHRGRLCRAGTRRHRCPPRAAWKRLRGPVRCYPHSSGPVFVPLAVFRFTRSGSRLLIEIKYYEVDILGKPENEGKSPEGGVRKHRPESRHCRVPGRWLWASPLTPSTSAETEVYQCNEGPISSVSVWQCGCEDQKKQRRGISSEA